jgi:hypothetical protein
MKNRDQYDEAILNSEDTKTLPNLMDIFIYSAVKIELAIPSNYYMEGTGDAAAEAKKALEEGGLNGPRELS